MKMKLGVERLKDMVDNVQCVPYAPGDTASIGYGPQPEANVAGASTRRAPAFCTR